MTECRACDRVRECCEVCGLCEDCHDHVMVVEAMPVARGEEGRG